MDTEALKEEPKPWEFRSKPTWQRLIIMVGGVTVNLLLGFLIYSMVLFVWGKERLPLANMSHGVYVDSVLTPYGLQDGDRIIGLEGKEVKYFEELGKEILIHGSRTIHIERDGQPMDVTLPAEVEKTLLESRVKSLFIPRFPFAVDSIIAGGPAERAGLQKEDVIVSVGGVLTPGVKEGMKAVSTAKGQSVEIKVVRNGMEQSLNTQVGEDGKIGIAMKPLDSYIETETYKYSFLESIPAGFTETFNILGTYISSMKLLFSKEGASQIGGFGAIGSMFAPVWDWHSFWAMTAFLSLILAFMNILPIPALDGGHVIFLLYEMITGRKPSDKFMEYTQTVGMVLLLALLVYANGNDIVRWIAD